MRKINGAHDDCEPQPVHDTDIPRAARSAKTASTNTPNHCHSPDTGSRSQLTSTYTEKHISVSFFWSFLFSFKNFLPVTVKNRVRVRVSFRVRVRVRVTVTVRVQGSSSKLVT